MNTLALNPAVSRSTTSAASTENLVAAIVRAVLSNNQANDIQPGNAQTASAQAASTQATNTQVSNAQSITVRQTAMASADTAQTTASK